MSKPDSYSVLRTEQFARNDLDEEARKWWVPHCGESHHHGTFKDSKDAHDLVDKLREQDPRDHYAVYVNYDPPIQAVNGVGKERKVIELCWNQLVIYRPVGDEDRPQLCAVDNSMRQERGTLLIGLVSGIYWHPEDDELVEVIDRSRFNDLVRVFEQEAADGV